MKLISKLSIGVATLLSASCFCEIENIDTFNKHATEYDSSFLKYANTEQGRFERSSKNALRMAYLSCDASDDEILASVKGMKKVSKKVHEWIKKCNKGLLAKQEPTVSLESFVEQAKNYQGIYNLVKDNEAFQAYNAAHKVFKKEVILMIKEGTTVDEVTDAMKKAGITNERTLSRPLYWKKKDID